MTLVCHQVDAAERAAHTEGAECGGVAVGERVRVDEKRGTVRWIGQLPTKAGSDMVWVGVEYDVVGQGKHDGSHNGVQKFECENGKG